MAKAYKALSNIDHGEGVDSDGNPVGKKFDYGELVVGLDADTMKLLWDAGVLEEVDVPDVVLKEATDAQQKLDDDRARAEAARQQETQQQAPEGEPSPAAPTQKPLPPAKA